MADVYSVRARGKQGGESEIVIGNWLKRCRWTLAAVIQCRNAPEVFVDKLALLGGELDFVLRVADYHRGGLADHVA
jgi:hypothetical protein